VQALEFIQNIELPEPNLKRLTFCDSAKPQRVEEWASNLRATRVLTTSSYLYEALPEVSRLKCSAQTRVEILEILRPYAQHCIETLSKSFLNQPISLPEDAKKAAIVAQSLQKSMIDGYIQAVKSCLIEKRQKQTSSPYFALSLHRAITGYGLLFYRSYQIYSQAPKGLWLALHSLFKIADSFELLDTQHRDPIQLRPVQTSIQIAYMRIILMATSRVNQLNQKDIGALYQAFAEWASPVNFRLGISDVNESFYCVNLNKDFGAQYKSRIGDSEQDDLIIELDFAPLLLQIGKQTKDHHGGFANEKSIGVPRNVSKAALAHVIDTLSNAALRRQERRPTQSTAEICIGLTDAHAYLSNGISFDEQIAELSRDSAIQDTLSSGFTPRSSHDKEAPIDHHKYRISVQNVSQGGYCLLWEGDSSLKIESGELIGLKEFGHKSWSIGVVRWIRQRRAGSQLGILLLSDRCKSAAIAQMYDMGGYADYVRALYIPRSKIYDEPETILCPNIPFDELDKVKLILDKEVLNAKLEKRLLNAGSIQRLSFRATTAANNDDNERERKAPTRDEW
jgi:hypothetical protein